jgi:ABC-2 type transport system permease protein
MYKVFEMVRQDLLTRASYRFRMLTSFGSLLAMLLPIYFITDALDPMMKGSIEGQGDHYFTFVLTGIIVMRFCYAIVNSLPGAFGSAIRTGTLEAMFATPTPLRVLVAGMVGFTLVWTTAEVSLLAMTGMLLGARMVVSQLLPSLMILTLILLAYFSIAVLGVALILVFRTTGPLLTGVLIATNLLGGIYYPTNVIPSWIQNLSLLLPMTYGLRALRQAVLEGAPLQAVWGDLAILCTFVAILLPGSWSLLHLSLKHARASGTLAQY